MAGAHTCSGQCCPTSRSFLRTCPLLLAPQRKVLEQFQGMRDSSWRVIDASQSIEDIQQQLREQAGAVVARCQRGGEPIKQLWGGGEEGGAPLAEIANVQ